MALRDKREILLISVIVLIGIAGFAAFLAYKDRAFPYAAIDFKISKSEVKSRAQDFLKKRGY